MSDMSEVRGVAEPSVKASFWRSFGPGLVWAGSAIGISHLVQTTRAGASVGLGLSGVILLALLFKYPFFEYGPRYASATGLSLIEGYRKIGRWALWLYLGIVFIIALITQAAIVLFTAFLLVYSLGIEWSTTVAGGFLYGLCGWLLWVGRYRALDLAIKVMLVTLAVCTLFAAFVVLPEVDFTTFSLGWPAAGTVSFGFLLALMGWMPSDIAASVYNSLWTLAKDRTTGVRATVGIARLDFMVAYAGTGILVLAFLLLGTGVMYGSGVTFSPDGPTFVTQLVELYTASIGDWIRPVILLLALITMFSTTFTVLDAFPRVIDRGIALVRLDDPEATRNRAPGRTYWVAFLVLGVGLLFVLAFFQGTLTTMVDLATGLAFLTGPVLGYLNLRAVTGPEMPEEAKPGPAMRIFSYVGLILLGAIALAFVASEVLNVL